MADRELQRVELSEHGRELARGVAVHDELSGVLASVEAPVRHGEKAQLGKRHGTAGLPEPPIEIRSSGAGSGLTDES